MLPKSRKRERQRPAQLGQDVERVRDHELLEIARDPVRLDRVELAEQEDDDRHRWRVMLQD